ncbi:MAG: hypothetical protein FJ398_16385 [Verrucomicrobia bacterium]|nr:hypothetical protein [Verrucomicrobiota bacterium]
MAFLKLTNESEATGAVKRLYDAALARAGCVANIIQVMSRDAATAEASIHFCVRLMKSENALSKARKEMLAAVVSNINDCYY